MHHDNTSHTQTRITECRIESKNLATAKTQLDRAKRREAAVVVPATPDAATSGVLEQVRKQQEEAAAKREAKIAAKRAAKGAARENKKQKKAAEKANKKHAALEAREAKKGKDLLLAAAGGDSDNAALVRPLYVQRVLALCGNVWRCDVQAWKPVDHPLQAHRGAGTFRRTYPPTRGKRLPGPQGRALPHAAHRAVQDGWHHQSNQPRASQRPGRCRARGQRCPAQRVFRAAYSCGAGRAGSRGKEKGAARHQDAAAHGRPQWCGGYR